MKTMKILSYKTFNLFLCYNYYGDYMKKIILFISIFFTLTGCINTKENMNNETNNNIYNEQNIENIPKEELYVDTNPVKVAIYKNSYKLTSYSTTLSNFKDIGIFNIYYTDIDKTDSSNTKTNYQKYYNEYENISHIKTGFYFEFEADGKKIEYLALDPTSKHAMTPYLYVYLYDDINQTPGTYYSHLEPDDIKENTVFSSIKLFLAQQGSKITSPITFTVFTYDSLDDFTEDNKYKGNSSYTIEIETK